MQEALGQLTGLQQQVCLLVLSLLFPELSSTIKPLSSIPVAKFKTPQEVEAIVDAFLSSGVAAQQDHGLVFVLGNTGSGKTSLTNTFKGFMESPTSTPKSVLTQDHTDMLETQVSEVYDLNLQQVQSLGVKTSGQKPVLVTFKKPDEAAKDSARGKRIKLKLVDMGG